MNDQSITKEMVLTRLAITRTKPSPLEIGFAIRKIVDEFLNGVNGQKLGRQESIRQASKMFGRSYTWTTQHLFLLRLCPEVQSYLEKGEISFKSCVALAGFKKESQVEFAQHIMEKKLNHKNALAYIHNYRMRENIGERGRIRKLSDDYVIFSRQIREMSDGLDNLLDMPMKKILDMFRTKPKRDVWQTITGLENLSNQAKLFADNLKSARRRFA
jgi:hypothetical protein